MTVSYSLDVSKARFGGFTKLLRRWRGSIYQILWREFLVFCVAYAVLSVTYRCILNECQRQIFEKVVIYVQTFTDLIPLSFVLGFYVSLVISRWWSQYEAIPWPDRVCFTIASYVHGSDERSRKIRRTLARYVVLLQVLTFQTVSTAVRRRFPTPQHLVAAGIMTKEELSVHDKLSFPYGKWWLPCHWFTALATRAKKEGRIKDTILLDGLFREVLDFRNHCAIMIGYDWISVPLVYTQVVTIATYLYSFALLVGRQYLDPSKTYSNYQVDLYIPFFTLLQFFFYVGWLKVAEQILNPYGEDEDDFELNWCLDRTVNLSYLVVDHLQMKHPKVRQDEFWDETEILLPQTKHSAKFLKTPQLGSAFKLEIDQVDYLPVEEIFEEDAAENVYNGSSFKRKDAERQHSSFIRRVIDSGLGQSVHKNSIRVRTLSGNQGCSNPAFTMSDENAVNLASRNGSVKTRKPTLKRLVKKMSPTTNGNSLIMRSNSLSRKKHMSYDLQEDKNQAPNGIFIEDRSDLRNSLEAVRTISAPVVSINSEHDKNISENDEDFEENPTENAMDVLMPPIPEEASRANSLVSNELMAAAQRGERASQQMDRVQDLVKEASEVLQELSKSVAVQEHWKNNEGKGYESCCSETSSGSTEESTGESSDEEKVPIVLPVDRKDVFVTIEDKHESEVLIHENRPVSK